MSGRTFFPRIGTGKIPAGANFRGYLFSGNRWGVVAVTPAREFLVSFSLKEQRAGWQTFYRDREGVQGAVDYLSDLYGEGAPGV